eukprot:5796842-Pyramimonas_sp.AAC.1
MDDCEWFRKALGLRSASANKCYELCEANCGSPNLSWHPANFCPDATWMGSLCTAEGWRAAANRH